VARLVAELLDLLLPPACAGCGAAPDGGAALCPACDARLPRLDAPRDPRPPAPLQASLAAVAFAGEAEAWIHRFKYPARGLRGLDPAAGAVLRALVVEAGGHLDDLDDLDDLGARPSAVVPVPQHPRALRARGFFPAGELARALARATGAPLRLAALERTRATRSQTGLARRERIANVRGAFAAREPVSGSVALVDDVTTTGSTLREAARALRRGGAEAVVAVCVARTL
jgi:ComF family protein